MSFGMLEVKEAFDSLISIENTKKIALPIEVCVEGVLLALKVDLICKSFEGYKTVLETT